MTAMYIYGVHPVEEVLRRAPGRITELVVDGDLSDRQFEAIRQLVGRHDISVRHGSSDELNRLADGGNHQRIAAGVSSYPYRSLDEVLEAVPDDRCGCVVALAQVQDPGNLGAILRSAAALEADAVVIPKHRSAQMTPAVVRASAGLALQVPLARVTNLARALRTLKQRDYWVVGTVADEGQTLWTMDWDLNAAVVIGGEHKGMRPGVEKECDFRVTIPMAEGVESLNAACAASVVLYDRLRGLRQ